MHRYERRYNTGCVREAVANTAALTRCNSRQHGSTRGLISRSTAMTATAAVASTTATAAVAFFWWLQSAGRVFPWDVTSPARVIPRELQSAARPLARVVPTPPWPIPQMEHSLLGPIQPTEYSPAQKTVGTADLTTNRAAALTTKLPRWPCMTCRYHKSQQFAISRPFIVWPGHRNFQTSAHK